MRVELSQIQGNSGVKGKAGAGSFTDTLKEGDAVKAEVLSSDKGVVTLKADSGQIIKARLDPEVALSPGDKVILEVTAKENGIISLAIREERITEEKPGLSGNMKGFEDKSLEPYANKLAELRMPVSEGAARSMRELIAQNPGMTLEEAAFLTSNKLAGDESLVRAALALLSGGEKTDSMLARLLDLMNQPGTAATVNQGTFSPVNPEPGVSNAVLPKAPLMELLAVISDAESVPQNSADQGGQTAQPAASLIISQSDSNMQSTNGEKSVEILQNAIPDAGQAASGRQNLTITEPGIRNSELTGNPGPTDNTKESFPAAVITDTESAAKLSASTSELKTPGSELRIPDPGFQAAPSPQDAATGTVPAKQNPAPEAIVSSAPPTSRALAEILSGIPEFRGTPATALERFSNMLYRVASDSTDKFINNTEKLESLLDKLFTRIEKHDQGAGERLRNAREELTTRLALIEETISRAAPPARAEMLQQTNKLMDHVRLLNSIDQFVYMQLPVMLSDERKTAELYLFKKKGGKKPDPENVNILLALDLENMGHWESLINFRNKDVSVRMEVAGEAEKAYFSENTVLLHEMLAEAGFKLVNTSVNYSDKEETKPLTALSSFEKYTAVRAGAIDFMI